jgi:hypothetical protein
MAAKANELISTGVIKVRTTSETTAMVRASVKSVGVAKFAAVRTVPARAKKPVFIDTFKSKKEAGKK